MKKKILIITTLLCLVGVASACKNSNEPTLQNGESLVGTTWKLVGYFDIEKNELVEADPTTSLRFLDTSLYIFGLVVDAIGYTRNTLYFKIYEDNKIQFLGGTRVDDSHNGNLILFYDALKSLETFKVENDKLIIYYNSNKKYLLYGRVGGDND